MVKCINVTEHVTTFSKSSGRFACSLNRGVFLAHLQSMKQHAEQNSLASVLFPCTLTARVPSEAGALIGASKWWTDWGKQVDRLWQVDRSSDSALVWAKSGLYLVHVVTVGEQDGVWPVFGLCVTYC